MTIAAELSRFSQPDDEDQLRLLDEYLSSQNPATCTAQDIKALLNIFERFPESDGFGVFWGIVHFLEKCHDYEPHLLRSASESPSEFNLLMVNRLINGGIKHVNGITCTDLLAEVAGNTKASKHARERAKHYLEYQNNCARNA